MFWSDPSLQPKRAYRWVVYLNGIESYTAKKVSKPSFTITESAHTYLNHKFYYPGRIEWNTVNLTLVDPLQPDAAMQIMAIINAAGYEVPENPTSLQTMSKASAIAALGNPMKIVQVDASGTSLETWELVNPWIKDAKFGELDYESDDMVEIELEIRYDYAKRV
jgi:hypothetical protein